MWATTDGTGKLASEPADGALADAARALEGKRTIVVLPGDSVLLVEAHIPGGSGSRAQQAVPFALEDQVADDIENLHFALGGKAKDDKYPVAVINRESMATLREQFDAAGLRPVEVVPETLALPKYDPGAAGPVWTALVDDEHTVVRLNGFKGFATDRETAGIMLSGAREEFEEEWSRGLVLFHTNDATPAAPVADLEVDARHCESRLGLYASGLASSPRINLLQGDFSYRQQLDQAWRPWRATMLFALALIAVLSAGSIIDYIRLGREQTAVNSQIEQVFKDTFPGVKVRRPRAQMKSRLLQLGDAGPSGGFTTHLGSIAKAFGAQPKTQINSISYRQGRFDLDVTTDALPTLDVIKSALEQNGSLSMDVQSANRQKGAVRSRIRLQEVR